MNTLFVDAGNTNVKWRLGGVEGLSSCSADASTFPHWIRDNRSAIKRVAISSVQTALWNLQLQTLCDELELEYWFARSEADSQGLISAYSQPENLGVDRWLAMLALWTRYSAGFVLVDSGTALTLDVVNNRGRHLGGYILPGFKLQRHALLEASENLEILAGDISSYNLELGRNTHEAIDHGALASVTALIEKLMRDTALPSSSLFFTGGGVAQLHDLVKQGHIEEDLVLQGLSMAWRQSQQFGMGKDRN